MSRKKIPAASLQNSLAGHLVPEAEEALKTCEQFLNDFELRAGAVSNLLAAKKHLQLGVAHCKAALVIIDFEVEDK